MSGRTASAVLSLLLLFPGSSGAFEQVPAGEPSGGSETRALCGSCHSFRLVEQQGMDRERWDETLDWMVEEQGMPELDPVLRTRILDYLVFAFPPDRPRMRGDAPIRPE